MELNGGIYWFTGLSGSGKTTLSRAVAGLMEARGVRPVLLDGDVMRSGLCSDLDFSPEARAENIRRAAELASLLSLQGLVCLCAFITPYEAMRRGLRERLGADGHIIFVDCPLETCMVRDPKGNYAQARQRKLTGYTGLGAPYERPESPDLRVDTANASVEECAALVLDFIRSCSPGVR